VNPRNGPSLKESVAGWILCTLNSIAWWVPVVLSFTGLTDYRVGFVGFVGVTAISVAANLYRSNALSLEQAEVFPLRSPQP
jgi:hypothetical protein